jgi:hypothetical protein
MISAPTEPVNEPIEDDPPRPKPKAKPLPWSSVPPQSIPERQQALVDLLAILAEPTLNYDLVVRMATRILYAFSGAKIRRILLGLEKLLETNGLPPIKPLDRRQCGIKEIPRLTWQESGNKRHIRAACPVCGAWIKWVSQCPQHIAAADAAGVSP